MKKTLFTLVLAWLIQLGAMAQMDVTEYITNPSFEDGLTGWTNNGFQTQTNDAFDLKIGSAYCEKWITGASDLPDASIFQTVSLENGNYTLEAVAGFNDADGPASGMYIIANGDSVEVSAKQTYSVTTDVTDGSLTIEVILSNANGNYAYFDHFVLLKKVDYTVVSISDTLFTFDEEIDTRTFSIDASNLTEDITITAPAGFTVDVPSISKTTTESTTVTITFGAAQDTSGVITISTAGTADQYVHVQGKVYGYANVFVPFLDTENLIADPYMSSLYGYGGWGTRAITTDPTEVYSGGTCYKGTSASLDVGLSGKLEGGAVYILRAMIKTNGTFNIGSFGGMLDPDQILYTGDTEGEWQLIETTFVPDGENGSLYINGWSMTATEIYVDNYEIYKLPPSDDATLSALSTNLGELDPEFDPETDAYEVTLPYGTTSLDIDATPSDLGSSISYVDGTGSELGEDGIVAFSEDGMQVEIIVTSSDGTELSYYLDIWVEDGASDATLQGIQIDGTAIDPIFSKEVKSYTAVVAEGTSTVQVTATSTFAEAIVTGDGNLTLVDGTVSTTISVKSKDESVTEEYSLVINEADGSNYALLLNGGNGEESHIKLSATSIDSLPLSIEMWMKPGASQAANAGLFYNSANNIGLAYASDWQGSQMLRFLANEGEGEGDGSNSLTGSVVDNVWHHVVVVMTDSTRTIYLDGAPTTENIGAYGFTSLDFSGDDLYIGWDATDAARAFSGVIDEVRVWDVALTDADVAANKYEVLNGDENNLVAYYNFDINSASNAIDLTSSQAHGMIAGGTYEASFPRANLELDTLALEGLELTPSFTKGLTNYTILLPEETEKVNVIAKASDASAILSGTGEVTVDSEGDIVVTVSSGEYTMDYTISYKRDVELTMTHSYSFVDGTAKDAVGNAHGTLYGEGYITEGIYYADSLGSYISFPGEEIAINTYPTFSVEAYILDTETINESQNNMLMYLGGSHEWRGVDGFFFSAKNSSTGAVASLFCNNYVDPWTSESNVSGVVIGDDLLSHHVVCVVNDSLTLYIDGVKESSTALEGDNAISNMSNDLAYLFKSGYSGDNTHLGAIYEYNIYKGSMTQEDVERNYTMGMGNGMIIDDEASDATLSSLKLDTVAIEGFISANLDYTVVLPFGTEVLPSLVAEVKVDGATAVVTDVTSFGETATVVVTSADEEYTNTYTIAFVEAMDPSISTLSDLTIADTTIAGFTPEVLEYVVTLENGAAVPTIEAVTTNPNAFVETDRAFTTSDTTFITVTSEDSTSVTVYEITFDEQDPASVEEVFKTDVKVYPTISNGEFTIEMDAKSAQVSVYTMTGQLVKQYETSLSKSSFSIRKAQMYLVLVRTERDKQVFRIIKK